MKTQNHNNIFFDQGCISKSQLALYASGKLTPAEKHEVEKHLVNCPLCTEAIEGFMGYEGKVSMEDLDFNASPLPGKVKTGFRKYYAAAAALATVVLLSYIVITMMRDVPESRIAIKENSEKSEMPLIVTEKQADQVLSDSIAVEEVNAVTQQSNIEHLNIRESIRDEEMPSGELTDKNKQKKEQADDFARGAISNAPPAANETALEMTGVNGEITYVDNLKVIEPSNGFSNVIKDNAAAKSESKKYSADAQVQTTEVASGNSLSYKDRLADGLALFNKARYQSAIFVFDELLAANPGNTNALFYKGVSNYHLKNYEAAIRLLEPFNKDVAHPFHEEAEYYIASALARKGDLERGSFMLKNIISNKGYNHRQASEELRNINK